MTRTSVGARLRAATVTVALSAGMLGAGAAALAPHASAATSVAVWTSKSQKAVHEAYLQRGKPYRYGAAGPSAFDCSGLVQYVYRTSLGLRLPRTAGQQYAASQHIRKTSLRIGDLVFVKYGSSISHVGIYAGNGNWWVAPHTGTYVKLQKIYTSSVVYGRVIH